MTDLDPAAIMAEHAGHRPSRRDGSGCAGDHSTGYMGERCLPYLLAAALAEAHQELRQGWPKMARSRSRANAAAIEQWNRADAAEAALGEAREREQRVRALTYASDDGTEYVHDHGPADGYPECPACWATDVRRALDGPKGGAT